jgi:hypothetical protein
MGILKEFDKHHYELEGIWFSIDTDIDFARFIVNAINTRKRIKIVYKAGWEDFSGYHGGDGLHHSLYVGKSGGVRKIPLHIYNKKSHGGPALITNKKAIESYK